MFDSLDKLSRLFAAFAVGAVLALPAPALAGEVRLLGEAKVIGDAAVALRLRDVAALDGPEAAALADLVVADLAANRAEARCTLDAVRAALTRRGVNWGRLTLRGPASCRIERAKPAGPSAPVAPPADQMGAAARGVTLRDQLVELIVGLTHADRADLRVEFADGDAARLALSSGEFRFELQPHSSTGLGRVPVTIRCWRGDKLEQTLRISADVSRRYLAAVAKAGINRGETLAAEQVELREVYLDESAGQPVTDLTEAIGREATGLIKQGSVVFARGLRAAHLVRRGEVITVRCPSGGVVLAVQMRAMDDGGKGEAVRVRSDDRKDVLTARVVAAREAVIAAGTVDSKADDGGAR